MSPPERHLRYWAKTSPSDPYLYHPVAYHCLDVAAVGHEILQKRPAALTRIAATARLKPETAAAAVTLLLALHDLGKLADGFQGLAPELAFRLQQREVSGRYDSEGLRHDSMGFAALRRLLRNDELPTLLPPGAPQGTWRKFSESWLAAAMGHHGVPPILDLQKQDLKRQFPPSVLEDLISTVNELVETLSPDGPPFRLSLFEEEEWDDHARRASWLLAGLAVTADWIGSNAEWFQPKPQPLGLERYFREYALPQAREAVAKAGLVEWPRVPTATFGELFPRFLPTPLQKLAESLPVAAGPQLVVVEEVTGGGKTEAAFLLAQRWLAAGRAEGLYVALPTMATSNAMYDRLQPAYSRLFAAGAQPSFVLAHGRRHLRLPLEKATANHASSEPGGSAVSQCTAWLADSRKKALLADVGVGTIDQALLAILKTRHQSLRLWGLGAKILVVDEVHAADAYVRRLLEVLLEAHAAFGGSAILLSATLPRDQRQRLIDAFAQGAGIPDAVVPGSEYPVLAHVHHSAARARRVKARAEASRSIAVHLADNEELVEETLVAAVEKGSCACWIRNTVKDAMTAYDRWVARLGGDRVTLFHSRFTVDDRNAIEHLILRAFGPTSGPAERWGRLVIATQVVEQSLDLDFDVLVTDLAPIDLLIQRAGRLCRHRRAADGTRHDEPDERGIPVLTVLSPEPDEGPDKTWYSRSFPGAAFVYPDHGRLWLGARWLADKRSLAVPGDLRDAIEHVYGDESRERIPEPLGETTDDAEGAAMCDASVAWFNAIDLAGGYGVQKLVSDWRSDVETPTRLGEPTITLRLARWVDGRVEPWHKDGPYPWDRSQVQIGRRLVAAEHPGDERLLEPAKKAMPDRGKYAVTVLLRPKGDLDVGWVLDGRGLRRSVVYSPVRGLSVMEED